MSNKQRMLTITWLLPAVLLCSFSLQAEPPESKGKSGKDKGDAKIEIGLSASITAGISFGDAHRLAGQYGLTNAKPLPPGIAKNLARGKPMPPGIAKTRMPDSFIHQLPRHDGYEWRQAGLDLVLVAVGTLVISDILEGVFE
jgi:hypothetical protein